MSRKITSILLLIAILFISLSLAGYSMFVSKYSATLPMMHEGMDTVKPAVQASETPVQPATPSSSGLATSSYSAPVTATTSGQFKATTQALSQKDKQAKADAITASS
jgi:hypothetical protein